MFGLHASQAMEGARGYLSIFSAGYVGVSFFFILSGFVLTWSVSARIEKRVFYRRRFARVWPLHAVTTLAVLVLSFFGGPSSELWLLLPVLLLLHAWVPVPSVNYAFNGPSWSLSVEAFFYAAFPFVHPLVAGSKRPLHSLSMLVGLYWALTIFLVTVGPVVLRALGRNTGIIEYIAYNFPIYRMLEFVMGMLLAAAIKRGLRSTLTPLQAVLINATAFALVSTGVNLELIQDRSLEIPLANALMCAPFLIVILAAASRDLKDPQGRVTLPSRTFVTLGRSSFALYLVHQPILEFLGSTPLSESHPVAAVLLGLLTSLFFAEVAHRTVEAPLERMLARRKPLTDIQNSSGIL